MEEGWERKWTPVLTSAQIWEKVAVSSPPPMALATSAVGASKKLAAATVPLWFSHGKEKLHNSIEDTKNRVQAQPP